MQAQKFNLALVNMLPQTFKSLPSYRTDLLPVPYFEQQQTDGNAYNNFSKVQRAILTSNVQVRQLLNCEY